MNDTYKNKYRILDLIFTFFNSLCMVLAAIFMLKNLIVLITFVMTIVFIALVFLFFWRSRNPFTIYLVRGFAYNNLFFTFFALMYFYYVISPFSTTQLAYILFLLPSIFYFTFSFKFSFFSYKHDKRTGATLAFMGYTKAAEGYLFKDKLEDKKNRKERITELKKEYPYKILIFLVVVLTLSSFYALNLGFY
jgi:hypothetical protein